MNLKLSLFNRCLQYIDARIETAQKAIEEVKASADDETKSSAGDKYETGRAMMQLEMEKNATQLTEAMKQKEALLSIHPETVNSSAQPGSLVITDKGSFYIAISAGRLSQDGETYFAISPVTPIGNKLMGLVAGSKFNFNDTAYTVKTVR